MIVKLSDREMVGVWSWLRSPVWGGDNLLDYEELWTKLGLDTRFEAIKGTDVDLAKVPNETADFELSDGAVALLTFILKRGGQAWAVGRTSAAALKRLLG